MNSTVEMEKKKPHLVARLLGCWKCGHIPKIWYVVLILIVIVSVLGMNEIKDEINMILYSNDIRDYPEILEIAENITAHCQDRICIEMEIEYYATMETTYIKDGYLDPKHIFNDPLETIRSGNDCEAQAILAIDMLKMLGYDNLYLVFQENHVCWMVKQGDWMRFYNCNDTDIREVKRVV